MNVEEIKGWFAIVLGALALLGHLKGYFSSGETKLAEDVKSAEEDITKAEATLISHDRRIQAVENEMRHLPSKDDMTSLQLSLANLTGVVGVLAESFKGVSSTVHNIDTWLREKGPK
jgi:Flp pilus assembly protein TadB